jgi:ABC-2 type transport system ATP-binding protein
MKEDAKNSIQDFSSSRLPSRFRVFAVNFFPAPGRSVTPFAEFREPRRDADATFARYLRRDYRSFPPMGTIETTTTLEITEPLPVASSESNRQSVVETESLRVRFDGLTAVDNISFALGPGHLLGLIGPNGAGKTTLLRTVCGLQTPSTGVVKILGEPLSINRRDLLAHIGFTPDEPPVYDNLTVRQFLRFIGRGYDLSTAEADDRIDFWLDKVWLREKAETKIKSLSRGMKQRIGIARTLLPNPAMIVLDEPAAGLDPAGRVQFRQLLCDLRDQGKALIVSSHILADMADYCTHIGIMTKGRMLKFGTVAEVTNMHDSARCRYTMLLSKVSSGLQVFLSQMEGLSTVQVERERVTFEFINDREAAAELLAKLVHMKVPVASFNANAADLEEAYLRVGIEQVD